ncbi:MFS transporter [Rubrolithibacter danxiaensis]|uniref:MFS transporter n=1 Tax=Rubrolithibacter danxiaensis TaxID=3390805 RepID=UPI003BF8271F
MNLPSSLKALQYYNFRLYFSGQAISLIGTWMQRIAVSWLVYNITHSAFMLGLVAFAGSIPVLLLSPYAGAFVDRHSRYRTLLVTQIASMIQAGLFTLVVFTGYYNITVIISLSVMLGIINAFDTPSRQSFMIVLVKDKAVLPNAIALNSSMVTLARLLGPAAAGIILTAYGQDICFLVNFISFFAVIASLLAMKIKVPVRKKNEEPIWKGLQEGYRYLHNHSGLRAAILLMAITSLVVIPYSNLFPVYAQDILKGDVSTFSWLNSISGLGALMGAIYMANRPLGTNLLKLIAFSGLLFTISLTAFSYTTKLPLSLAFIMTGEAGMLTQIAATNTYVQTNVDEHMRGRVVSYYVMAFQGMQPIGSLIIGGLAHITSAPFTVLAEGLAGIAAILFFIPVLKKARKEADAKREHDMKMLQER